MLAAFFFARGRRRRPSLRARMLIVDANIDDREPRPAIDAGDRSQIAGRLRLSPIERLRYLLDMLAFEELARHAHVVNRR